MLFLRSNYCTHELGTAYRWREGGLSRNTVLSGSAVQAEIARRYRRRFTAVQWLRYWWYKLLRLGEIIRLYICPTLKHWLHLRKKHILKLMGMER